ncbi:O-antigen ligase family protein [Aeromonas sp. V90_14]|uniref:O-antigen ligase family protein n=1 Tax=Aeromonas sp. V90_14 TaxID=3044241 RepID=UPI00249E0509|nr:O-antigen ligase family protein [Aeromonas sp. V90_14]MDI3428898.1 O-antigen ligase family protein [Aeromonas sp. V90_14]
MHHKIKIELSDIISWCVIFLVTFGQLEVMIANKVSNFTHLIISVLIFFHIIVNADRIKGGDAIHIIILLVSFLFLIFPSGKDLIADVSRLSWFFLIGFIGFHFKWFRAKYSSYISLVLKFYVFLGFVIILDACLFFLEGRTYLFPVEYYLMPRFSGPFNDPNFLGFIYGVLLISAIYSPQESRWKKIAQYISVICILLSGSVSAIFFAILSLALSNFFRLQYSIVKPIVCILVSFVIYPVLYLYSDAFLDSFNMLTNTFFGLSNELSEIKFRSLIYRFESVSQAISLFAANPLGYGHKTLLEFLPRDTHNSYVGMSFEFGIFPIIAILSSLAFRSYSKVSSAIVTYACLMAMMLNVHYSPIYIFVLLVAWINRDYRNTNASSHS